MRADYEQYIELSNKAAEANGTSSAESNTSL